MPEVLRGIHEPIKQLDHEIGRRIRLLRVTKGLSQTEVAKRIGCSVMQWQKCENGHKRISVGTLILITNKLGISVQDLLTDDFKLPPRYDLSAPLHKSGAGDGRKIRASAGLFKQMEKITDPEGRQLVASLIRHLAGKMRSKT